MNRLHLVAVLAAALGAACATSRPPTPVRVASPVARPWWDGAVFYEVFVRSFADSDGDGVGDFKGLTAKLDLLNDGDETTTADLGVDALWLMPVFASPSYHGYDVTDFGRINPAYGTEADFDAFLAQAHRRGIKVVLDLMLNHTSSQHPWFLDSASGPTSPRRDWYLWRQDNPGWGQPWNASGTTWHLKNGSHYYGLFWSGMPDLNFTNPEVRRTMTQVAVDWARRGVDGFRLDAIRHLIETGPGRGQAESAENHVYLKSLAAALKAERPEVALLGEVWSTTEDIARYYGDGKDELHLAFNFPLAEALVNAAWSGDGTKVKEVLAEMARRYPAGAVDAPFLTNHDQVRVATALQKDRARLGLAAALLLSLPGAPFIYYGEELGLANGPGGADEQKRTPMPWTDGPAFGFTTGTPWQVTAAAQVPAPHSAQRDDPSSLLSRYRALIRARHASPALGSGSLRVVEAGTPAVLAFVRELASERVLVVHNLKGAQVSVSLPVAARSAQQLFADQKSAVAVAAGAVEVTLPGLSSGFFRLE